METNAINLENPIMPELNAASNVKQNRLNDFVTACAQTHAIILSLNRSKETSEPLKYALSDLLKVLSVKHGFKPVSKEQKVATDHGDNLSSVTGASAKIADEMNI